jgi:two-component system, NarL family, invasion response regulator UvrY
MHPTAPVRPVRVLVVDDSSAFREGVHALIDATPGFEWIGEAASGEQGIEQAAHLCPDLVLLDVRMPGLSGVETARTMATLDLPGVVVLITGGETPTHRGDAATARAFAKERLSPAALRRLWEERSGDVTQIAS